MSKELDDVTRELRIIELEAQLAERNKVDINGCSFSGPGRGDCEHFVGFPSPIHAPSVHDGPDDTVDAYGKPNGWCWSCWKSRQNQQLREQLAAEREAHKQTLEEYRDEVRAAHVMQRENSFQKEEITDLQHTVQYLLDIINNKEEIHTI